MDKLKAAMTRWRQMETKATRTVAIAVVITLVNIVIFVLS